MATIKEKAQQEYELYQGLRSIVEDIQNSNKQLLESFFMKESLKKIVENKKNLENFIKEYDKLSEQEQQEKWSELKANNKIMVSKTEKDSVRDFFQKIDSTIAKTEAYKNLYKIYLKNMVSEKGQKTNSWRKEKEKLTARKNAVMQKRAKYEDPEYKYDFEKEYTERKGYVDDVKEMMENERHKHAPEYLKLQEEYTNKYKEKGGVLIEDQEYLKSLWESLATRKTSFEKALTNNTELEEKQIALIKKEIEQIEEKQEQIMEMSNDAAIIKEAREKADSSPNMTKYKEYYKQAMERFAPLEEIKKEYDAVKKESEQLEKKIDADVIVEGIKNIANILAEQDGMHKGNHDDSKSYQMMMTALDIVKGWNDKDAAQKWQTHTNAPATLNDALRLLEKASQQYLDEKNAQFRPFPSALRQSRLSLAETINEFAKDSLVDLKLPEKELIVENKLAKVEERNSVRESIDAFNINNTF